MTGGHRREPKQQQPVRDEPFLKYLRDTPITFQEIADVLLILDSGEELPTHRQVLSLKSEVFCCLFESAPKDTGPEKKLRVPLPDCSSAEARIFLDFVYNMAPVSDPLEAEALTKVAHKFNVRSALQYCDAFLASRAEEDPNFFNLGQRGSQQRSGDRNILDWALMANRFQLKQLTARCELWIMQNYHASPSSKRVLAALSPESQLRIYKGCAEAKPTCTAKCQACGRVLMQGESFHVSKALTSCGHENCTGCVKAKAALTEFPSLDDIESWQP